MPGRFKPLTNSQHDLFAYRMMGLKYIVVDSRCDLPGLFNSRAPVGNKAFMPNEWMIPGLQYASPITAVSHTGQAYQQHFAGAVTRVVKGVCEDDEQMPALRIMSGAGRYEKAGAPEWDEHAYRDSNILSMALSSFMWSDNSMACFSS